MPLFLTILQILQWVLMAYIMILVIRIFLSYLSSRHENPALGFLRAITDPYLNLFRRLRLRIGVLDLSPVVAIWVLYALDSVLQQVPELLWSGRGGLTNPFFYLALVLSLVWSLGSAVLFLLVLALGLRALSLRFGWNGEIWMLLDRFLQRLHMGFFRLFTKRFIGYQTGLWVLFVLFLALDLGLNLFLVPWFFVFLMGL